jgi:hypothetical protein
MISMITSQMTADHPIAEADAPEFAHGDTAESPIPVPKARRARDRAAVTNAPAAMAGHDTPEVCESFLASESVNATRSTKYLR